MGPENTRFLFINYGVRTSFNLKTSRLEHEPVSFFLFCIQALFGDQIDSQKQAKFLDRKPGFLTKKGLILTQK